MFFLERALAGERLSDLFADDRAHGATHEGEVHDAEVHWGSSQLAAEGQDRVTFTGGACGLLEALWVFGKAERVGGPDVDLGLFGGSVV